MRKIQHSYQVIHYNSAISSFKLVLNLFFHIRRLCTGYNALLELFILRLVTAELGPEKLKLCQYIKGHNTTLIYGRKLKCHVEQKQVHMGRIRL